MGKSVDELEAIRERLIVLERRLSSLEGGDNRRDTRSGLGRLSDAERRIVALVVAGQTNDEVAEQLNLSPKTIEWSLTRVYRKLRVRSRAELAAQLGAGATSRGAGETPGAPLGPAGREDEPGGPLHSGRPRSDSQAADPEERGDS